MFLMKLEILRKEKKDTQQNIADFLGCQREVYRRYEKGIRSIPIEYLIKLAEYYNVSLDYIAGASEERKPYPNK